MEAMSPFAPRLTFICKNVYDHVRQSEFFKIRVVASGYEPDMVTPNQSMHSGVTVLFLCALYVNRLNFAAVRLLLSYLRT